MENTQPQPLASVFVVEDSPIVRKRLVAMLDETPGVCIVGEADCPNDAVDGIRRTRPDWVVLDIQLIGGTGIDVLRKVRAEVPKTGFIVLTHLGIAPYRRLAEAAGADYFLDKTETAKLRDIIGAPGAPAVEGRKLQFAAVR
jgi:DNA-binding NarL/FixJ family response regulator